MKANGIESIQAILCTHYHNDHIGGIPDIRREFGSDIPIYKYCNEAIDAKIDLSFLGISDLQQFECEGATLIAHHCPGHCDDHIVFELKEEKGIFSGDCILGEGSS